MKTRLFGWRRALRLWWTLRAIAKIARRPVASRYCSLCGHLSENRDRRGCRVHDADGPCVCPRDERGAK